MSTQVLRKTMDNLELLERMLNKTHLSTKRVAHGNIIGIGEDLLAKTYIDVDALKQAAVTAALEEAENRHTRELQTALHRLTQEKDEEREQALEKQKQIYEDLALRVAEERDKAEEEHLRQLTVKLERQREEALKQQWAKCERLKQSAIKEACEIQRSQLRQEFLTEREKAVAEALAKAREKHKKKVQEAEERIYQECQDKARKEAAQIANLHAEEVKQHQLRYAKLYQKYQKIIARKNEIEAEFKELQADYKRFIDYTDGKYHSDYMMKLRKYGQTAQHMCASVVTIHNIRETEKSNKLMETSSTFMPPIE